MTHDHEQTLEEIETTVARARDARAEAIRASAVGLNLLITHFLNNRREPASAPMPAKA